MNGEFLSSCPHADFDQQIRALIFIYFHFLGEVSVFKDFINLFLERGEGRERTSMCKRNIDQMPLTCPQPGTWPEMQACVLTRNQTGDFLVLWEDALSTKPHQSRLFRIKYSHKSRGFLFTCHKIT